MNPYVTVADFRAYASPRDAFPGVADEDIQYALDVAADEAEGFWRVKNALPMTIVVPMAFKEAIMVMAWWRTLIHRGTTPNKEPAYLYERYKEITGDDGYLERLARGVIAVVTEDGGAGDLSSAPVVVNERASRSPYRYRVPDPSWRRW